MAAEIVVSEGIIGAAVVSNIAYLVATVALISLFLRLVPGLTARELLIPRAEDLRIIRQTLRP